MRRLALLAVLLLAQCGPDETISGYADPGAVYVLEEIDDAPFPARATISFPEEGRVAGDAPCNAYLGKQTAPYPWFEIGQIAATERACADLAAERDFLSALPEMSLAEVQGGILILSNDDGREMVFRAVP